MVLLPVSLSQGDSGYAHERWWEACTAAERGAPGERSARLCVRPSGVRAPKVAVVVPVPPCVHSAVFGSGIRCGGAQADEAISACVGGGPSTAAARWGPAPYGTVSAAPAAGVRCRFRAD